MFDTFQSRLTIDGYLVAESGLRVGIGRAAELVGTELAVIRDNHDRPFIPGSSFKGALRSYLEAVVRGMASADAELKHVACDPTKEDEQCVQSGRLYSVDPDWEYPQDRLTLGKPVGIEDLHQGLDATGENQDRTFTKRLLANTCLACRTFGSPWLASPVRMRDMPVVAEEWFGLFDVRDGVAIARDKGTAADGKLYDYEVVPAGTRFELHVEAENLDDWQCGLLWLGLRALKDGRVALGGFTSRGLGWIRLEEPEVLLVEGAGEMLTMMAGAKAGETVDEKRAIPWVAALRSELKERGEPDA